jgi:hypothetical protein
VGPLFPYERVTTLTTFPFRAALSFYLASATKRATSTGSNSNLRQSRTGRRFLGIYSLPFLTQLRTVCGLTDSAFATASRVSPSTSGSNLLALDSHSDYYAWEYKMSSTLPDYRFIRYPFYTPICVENVRLVGASIVGKWTVKAKRLYPEMGITVGQRFTNCDGTPEAIRAFTKSYGPVALTQGVGEFRFSVDEWVKSQREFQKFWRVLAKGGSPARYTPLPGDAVEFSGKGFHLRCGTLWTFMMYELLSRTTKVRICERPDCKHPYFVAQHGKERYCSTGCSNWSQAQLKKRWHENQRQKRIESQSQSR